jgi:hypothetical protein
MPLQKLPTVGLDDINHRKRARETINKILDHSFDDSRVQTSAEKLAGVTPVNYAYPPLNILRYGADPTGIADSGPAFNYMVSVMASAQGGDAIIPPGQYLFSTQPLITGYFTGNASFWCYGAEFYSSGNIFGLSIEYNGTPHQLTVYGLTINHRGNATADGGFELSACNHVRLKDCTVEAHGVDSTYSCYLLHNSDPADSDTGCFWTVLEDCTVRKRSGSDSGNIPIGVSIIGAANSTMIRGGSYGATCTQAIYIAPESGETYIANAVLIDGVAFEGGTDAITVAAAASQGISGLRIVNCRCEAYTTFISLDTATVNGAVAPYFAGNYLTPEVAYISNGNSLRYVSLDSSNNAAQGWNADLGGAFEVENTSGSGECLVAQAATTSSGMVSMRNSAGTLVGKFRQGTNTADLRLQAQSANSLEIIAIKGVAAGNTACLNLNGTVTFASAATATVTFTNTEVDGNYLIQLAGNANEVFWWSARGTTGFTINSSNATSTAIVHWWISRT